MLSCCLCQIPAQPSKCFSRNRGSSVKPVFSSLMFSNFYEPVQIFGFQLLADMSSTQCDLLLLCPLCFKIRCAVYSEMVFYNSNKWLFELMLSSYQLKRIWSFSSHMNWDGYTSGGRAGHRLIRSFVDHLLAASVCIKSIHVQDTETLVVLLCVTGT